MKVTNEFDTVWKEVSVTYFQVYFMYFNRLGKTTKNLDPVGGVPVKIRT